MSDPPERPESDGLLPLLALLSVVLGLWTWIISNDTASAPPRFGHRRTTTSPFKQTVPFPSAMPVLSRDYVSPH